VGEVRARERANHTKMGGELMESARKKGKQMGVQVLRAVIRPSIVVLRLRCHAVDGTENRDADSDFHFAPIGPVPVRAL